MPIKFTLNRNSTTSMKAQIVWHVNEAIRIGELAPGEQLPPIGELAAQLGCHIDTVRLSLRALRKAGTLIHSPGIGTFVAVPGAADVDRDRVRVARLARQNFQGAIDRALASGILPERLHRMVDEAAAARPNGLADRPRPAPPTTAPAKRRQATRRRRRAIDVA